MTISKSSFSCYITEILYNQRILKLENLQQQTSMDKDGRLRTLHPSIRPCGQRTETWAQTVHLEFGRRAKIIILRRTTGQIFDHGPSTWTIGRFIDSMDGFLRQTINISTR